MRRAKIILAILVFDTFLVAGFLLLAPISGWEPATSTQAELAEFEARTSHHFERIESASGLDLPFPEMPVRAENPTTPERVELGRLLYFDPVVSGDDTVSCAHCHHPDLGFSDNRGRSMGKGGHGLGPDRREGALLRRGSPTVWNAAYNHLQFWDGRAKDLEDQAAKPIMDPNEMAEEPPRLEKQLREIPEYVELFEAAFPDATLPDNTGPVTFENATFAIAAFERTIVSDDSAFDRYARGDRDALTDAERRGLNVFRSLKTRCFECHNLPTFNNPDFKVVGVPETAGLDTPDLGRAEIEGGRPYERAFKVPTLRNVALTAPYMHNGTFDTLAQVIEFYAGGGGPGVGMELANLDDKIRPFTLSDQEQTDLIAFLHALTDESNKPEIPESVPSGLPPVESLPNQSPEMAAFEAPPRVERELEVVRDGTVLRVSPGMRIQDAIDAANPGDVIEIEPGEYHETLTLDVSDLTLRGLTVDGERPVLDGRGVLSDGAIGSGSRLVLENFDVRGYTANGIMINLGQQITFRNLGIHDTGLYGLYPVEVVGVLVEGSTVTGAKDAGIYVGQSKDILVRGNVTHGNVTGIEIENSLNAVVEDNEVYDNAGGILVFGLPNVPSKMSSGCVVRNNVVRDNNHVNFGDPSAIVSKVPSGTGILVLAGDDVEITGNQIVGNQSFGVGVASLGLILDAGRFDIDPYPDRVLVSGNELKDNGQNPDPFLTESGFPGADLLWDLSGQGNAWDQPEADSLPSTLPGPEWGTLRRRANYRVWSALASLAE